MIKELVGYRIKELRINEANLTQEQLAKKLNWDRTFLSRVESGKQNLTLESLELVCKALKIDLKDFFAFMDKQHIEGLYDGEN